MIFRLPTLSGLDQSTGEKHKGYLEDYIISTIMGDNESPLGLPQDKTIVEGCSSESSAPAHPQIKFECSDNIAQPLLNLLMLSTRNTT